MLDINPGELLILLVVAVVVIGPERLPKYAAELARMVREVRTFARNAREQVREEMGEEFDDVDWQALDPRRYDPRRIVREALLDDDDDEPQGSDRAPKVPRAMRSDDDGPHGATAAGASDGTANGSAHGSGDAPAGPRPGSAYDADAT